MVVALLSALVTTVSYGVATVLQAVGARRGLSAGHLDVKLIARTRRQSLYLTGLALDAVGFVAALVALRTLPLFVVQAAIRGQSRRHRVVGRVASDSRARRVRQDRGSRCHLPDSCWSGVGA